MNSSEQHSIRRLPACGLPAWWRFLLVGVGDHHHVFVQPTADCHSARASTTDTVIISDQRWRNRFGRRADQRRSGIGYPQCSDFFAGSPEIVEEPRPRDELQL